MDDNFPIGQTVNENVVYCKLRWFLAGFSYRQNEENMVSAGFSYLQNENLFFLIVLTVTYSTCIVFNSI